MSVATESRKDVYGDNCVDRFRATLEVLGPEFDRMPDPVIYDIGGYRYLTDRLKAERGYGRALDVCSPDLNTVELDLEDASADVVLLCEVIEHLWNPDLVLKECRRVLRSGGFFVLTTPNLASWFNRILLSLGYFPLNQDISCQMRYSGKKDILGKRPVKGVEFNPLFDVHVRLYNLRSLELLLEEHGFRVVESKGYFVSGSVNHRVNPVLGALNRAFARFPSLAQGLIIKAVAA